MYPELSVNAEIKISDQLIRILRKLSSGTSCVTYMAMLKTGSYCVLKEFAPRWLRRSDCLVRSDDNRLKLKTENPFTIDQYNQELNAFNSEPLIVAKLNAAVGNNHPNVFQYSNIEDGLLLMETTLGCTLEEWKTEYQEALLSRNEDKRTSYMQACVLLVRRLISILHSIHESGTLHMDVKPTNIFIVGENLAPEEIISSRFAGTIHLLDFGSAKERSAFKETNDPDELISSLSYSPGYAHPAVLALQRECGTSAAMQAHYIKMIDPRIDWYAVSCVLAHLLNADPVYGKAKTDHLLGFSGRIDRIVHVLSLAIQTGIAPAKPLAADDIRIQTDRLLNQAERALKNEAGLCELFLQLQSSQIASHVCVDDKLLSRVRICNQEASNFTSWFLPQKNGAPVRAVLHGSVGGAGKTSQMRHLHQELANDKQLIPLYIPLRHVDCDEGFLGYAARTYGKTNNREALSKLICESRMTWVFLLDGFNEATHSRLQILEDLREICNLQQVHILISSREEIHYLETAEFQSVQLLPLDRTLVTRETGELNPRMIQLLCNPMMLTIYRQVASFSASVQFYQYQTRLPIQINTAAELMNAYLETQIIKHRDVCNLNASGWRQMYHRVSSLADRYSFDTAIEDRQLDSDDSAALRYAAKASIVITRDEEYSWEFTHESWHSLFIAKKLAQDIRDFIKTGSENKMDLISQLNSRVYSQETLLFSGQLLEEYKWIPSAQENSTILSIASERSPIQTALDLFKGKDGLGKATANLIGMMRLGREDDLSAADLSRLDLTQSNLLHVCFSRRDEQQTDFSGSLIDLSCFLPQDNIHGIYPWKHYWVGIDDEGIFCIFSHQKEKISHIRCSYTRIAVKDCGDHAIVYALDDKRKNLYHTFRLNKEGILTPGYSRSIELRLKTNKNASACFIFDEAAECYRIKESDKRIVTPTAIRSVLKFYANSLRCIQNRIYAINTYNENIGIDIETGEVFGDPSFMDGYGEQMIFHPQGNITRTLQPKEESLPDYFCVIDEKRERMAYFYQDAFESACDMEIWSIYHGKLSECLFKSRLPLINFREALWYDDLLIAFCKGYCCMINLQGHIIWRIGIEEYKWTVRLSDEEADKIHHFMWMRGDPDLQGLIQYFIDEEALQDISDHISDHFRNDLAERIHDPGRMFEFSLSTDEPNQFKLSKHCEDGRANRTDCRLTLDDMDHVFRNHPLEKPVFLQIQGCLFRDIRFTTSDEKLKKLILQALAYCGAILN